MLREPAELQLSQGEQGMPESHMNGCHDTFNVLMKSV